MVCSPEQIESNRRNSLKSKGPASPETKALVRKNALKHGLTGQGIVVLDEDVAVIEQTFEEFNADLNPLGAVSEFLVRHLSLLAVRMQRCARHETAVLNQKMTLVRQAEANLVRLEIQAQVARLIEEPEAACRELAASPRGIAWMISSWQRLQAALADPDVRRWEMPQVERVENLSGRLLVAPDASRIVALSLAYHGHLEAFEDWPELPEAERREAARAELARIIGSEIARLNELLPTVDDAEREKREADALALALFDASKEAVLARKYAAAAERAFFKTLKTIQELNAQAIVNAATEVEIVTPDTETDSEKLALNFPPPQIVEGPPTRRPPAPADRPKSKGRRSNRDPRRLKA